MKIEKKSYYFIKDKYFVFANDKHLLLNKENHHSRPCFFVVQEENQILWLVPISSKIEKYRSIYTKKKKKLGFCNTIIFGTMLNRDCVFLLQNIFPVTKKYILKKYVIGKEKSPVKIENELADEIIEKSNKILSLVRNGNKNIVFPDILEIERKLLEELNKEEQSVAFDQKSFY